MKIEICIVAAIFAAGDAIISQPSGCIHPDICSPRIITTCPNKNPIADCSTCCCTSTENVEFFSSNRPEPRCTAPPAVYTVKFVGTWSGVCHPDYNVSTAHWSPATGASHNTKYLMWDACMENVSEGVAQVSQTGATELIEEEYKGAGDNILDTFKADRIDGVGETSRELNVDKDHQWVSVVSMLAPSLDRMVGVANLRLCGGHDWKRYVKICAELFSTATRSERVHSQMSRNSIQWNNCSFGYFEFTFKEYNDSTQEPHTECESETHGVCPSAKFIPDKCRTCCCLSSDNVELFHPNAPGVSCGSQEPATYKVALINFYNPVCHPDYIVPPGLEAGQQPYFTRPSVSVHRPVQVLDRCFADRNILFFVRNIELMAEDIIQDVANQTRGGTPHILPDASTIVSYRFKRRVAYFTATPSRFHASVVSKLLPSTNTFVGISGLVLCDGSGWKERIEVCMELLAAVNKTETPDAEIVLQGNQCTFGSLIFELKSTGIPPVLARRKGGVSKKRTCKPLNGSTYEGDIDLQTCCAHEFIIEGKIIRRYSRPYDSKYSHTLLVKVESVYYDEISHIQVEDILEIKICGLPDRIKWNSIYRMAGTRECGTNELEISEKGIFADTEIGEGPCPPYILRGDCDDLP